MKGGEVAPVQEGGKRRKSKKSKKSKSRRSASYGMMNLYGGENATQEGGKRRKSKVSKKKSIV